MEITSMVTKRQIINELKELGVKRDDTLIVHSSMKSLGWVNGGAQAIVEALIEVVSEGTIIMPSQSSDNSDPTNWQHPPILASLHQELRETMPAYDQRLSAVRGMGKVVETFLRLEGVIRSNHPQVSFCGYGPKAFEILSTHQLEFGLYKNTPVEKMIEMDTKILLLGVDYDSCTLMHYAEYESGIRETIIQGSSVYENNHVVWKEFKELDLDSDIFLEIGKAYEDEVVIVQGKVGAASVKVLSSKDIVNFASVYLKKTK